jgi:hypothetical protein
MCLAGFVLILSATAALSREQPKIPPEVLKNFQYFVGSWKTMGRVGDVESEGTWVARLGKGENCLIRESSYMEDDEAFYGTGVIGWDAAKKCIAEYAFWTHRHHVTLRWKLDSSGNLEGKVTGFEDGKEFTVEAKVIKKGPDEFVYESTNAAGEEIEVRFRKVVRK